MLRLEFETALSLIRNILAAEAEAAVAADLAIGGVFGVPLAGVAGYIIGGKINRAIEKQYGQNAGGALYDILHPPAKQPIAKECK